MENITLEFKLTVDESIKLPTELETMDQLEVHKNSNGSTMICGKVPALFPHLLEDVLYNLKCAAVSSYTSVIEKHIGCKPGTFDDLRCLFFSCEKMPILEDLQYKAVVKPIESATSADYYEEIKQDDTPLMKWLIELFNSDFKADDAFRRLMDYCNEGYIAHATLATLTSVVAGDIISSGYRDDYIVKDDGTLAKLETDGKGLSIIPIEFTSKVDDPVEFWRCSVIGYVELAADHPMNSTGRVTSFSMDTGYDDAIEDPRDV